MRLSCTLLELQKCSSLFYRPCWLLLCTWGPTLGYLWLRFWLFSIIARFRSCTSSFCSFVIGSGSGLFFRDRRSSNCTLLALSLALSFGPADPRSFATLHSVAVSQLRSLFVSFTKTSGCTFFFSVLKPLEALSCGLWIFPIPSKCQDTPDKFYHLLVSWNVPWWLASPQP